MITNPVEASGPESLRVFVRTPAPLAFAAELYHSATEMVPLASPYLLFEPAPEALRYRLLTTRIRDNPADFADILENAIRFEAQGEPLPARLIRFRISPGDPRGAFTDAASARAALDEPSTDLTPVFAEAVIEYELEIPVPLGPLTLQSGLPQIDLPQNVAVDQHIIDARSDTPSLRAVEGQLTQPVTIWPNGWWGLADFGARGLDHILTGIDHILLITCFALAVGWSSRLLWLVTAFTLGHSVTLAAGVLGYTPRAIWFIPSIETLIAVTVFLAAAAALLRSKKTRGGVETGLAALVGLIHGFGFASFISDALGPQSPFLLASLAGFNLGIELGQIAIVFVITTLFALLQRYIPRLEWRARIGVLIGIGIISAAWTVERGAALWEYL
ncbi:MAG: HupE/UreJ family protein [Mangrovicoccus sp.]